MRLFKRILKIVGVVLFVLISGLLIAAHQFLKPTSDQKIKKELNTNYTTPTIKYNKFKDYEYRVVSTRSELDTTLPILIFVHGSPGAAMDFERYLKDSTLNARANLVAYDRVGYGPKNNGNTPADLKVEVAILHDLIKEYPEEKIVLAGYSYGGPVILASDKNYKYKISMAAAVVGEYEPMFKALVFYDFKATRWLMPAKARAAAKEKYAHVEEFPQYKEVWNSSASKIINIHGDEDWIVPYKNSEFLQEIIDANKFEMVTIKGGGHDLIWTNFDLIKKELLKTLD